MRRDRVGDCVPLRTGDSSAESDESLPYDAVDVHVKMREVVMFWEKGEDFYSEIVGLECMA